MSEPEFAQGMELSAAEFGTLQLTTYTLDDLEDISTLELAAGAHPWSKSAIRDSLKAGHLCLGLKDSQNWLAHAICTRVVDEVELLIFSVRKEMQRRGLGFLFLETIFLQLKPIAASVYLDVRRSNAAAQQLYKKLGFVEVGLRRGYYRNADGKGEDALLFELSLAQFRLRSAN